MKFFTAETLRKKHAPFLSKNKFVGVLERIEWPSDYSVTVHEDGTYSGMYVYPESATFGGSKVVHMETLFQDVLKNAEPISNKYYKHPFVEGKFKKL